MTALFILQTAWFTGLNMFVEPRPRKGVMTRYGKKMVRSDFYGTMTVAKPNNLYDICYRELEYLILQSLSSSVPIPYDVYPILHSWYRGTDLLYKESGFK